MPFLRTRSMPDPMPGVAQQAGLAGGWILGNQQRRSAEDEVTQRITDYTAGEGLTDHPLVYQAKLLGILKDHGLTPGDNFARMLQTKMLTWDQEQKAEEKRQARAEKLGEAQAKGEADLSSRMAGARYGQEAGLPESFWKGTLTGAPKETLSAILETGKTKEAKPPETREVIRGNTVTKEQWDPGTGTFIPIGTGPRWQDRETAEKPPAGRTIHKGQEEIYQEWDAGSKTWKDVSRGPRWAPKEGESIEVGPDGTVRIVRGAGAGTTSMTKGSTTESEKKIKDLDAQIADIRRVAETIDPELMTFGGRWQALKATWGQKLKGVPVVGEMMKPSAQDMQLAHRAYRFKARAWAMARKPLQEGAGKALTPMELKVYLNTLPDPGTGLFDGDGPDEFITKLMDRLEDLSLARMREEYYLRNGVTSERYRQMLEKGEVESLEPEEMSPAMRRWIVENGSLK